MAADQFPIYRYTTIEMMNSFRFHEGRGAETMDCCICGAMASVYRPPRNTICLSCYEGARNMVAFLDELEGNGDLSSTTTTKSPWLQSAPSKGMSNVFKWVKEMKELEQGLKEKLGFVDSFVDALRDGIHTDILIKAGDGPPIPAHKALLATKSEIFKTMLISDECKAPADDTISLPELSHEQLTSLLEFLYCGSLPEDKADKHAHTLLIAADKYDIPFLRSFSEQRMLAMLSPSNALDVLEVSELCSNRLLKERAINSIVKHAEDVVFSPSFDSFVLKNAHLSVEITRALLTETKAMKGGGAPP